MGRTIFAIALTAAVGYVGYHYVKYGRLPFMPAPTKPDDTVKNVAKDVQAPPKPMSREVLHPCPLNMVCKAGPGPSKTTVVVTLKPEAVAEYRNKYAKIRVAIGDVGFDETVPSAKWPDLGSAVQPSRFDKKLKDCAITVYGIRPDQEQELVYSQDRPN